MNNTISDTQSKDSQPQPEGTSSGGEVLVNLENLIKNHDASIDKIKVELKKHREMLTDVLANDPTYKQHDDKAKEAAKVRNMTRGQILKRPDCQDLVTKIKGMQTDLKELTGALSDYLREYARMSGTNEIQGNDGETREIVYTARLVKKPSKNYK